MCACVCVCMMEIFEVENLASGKRDMANIKFVTYCLVSFSPNLEKVEFES